MGRQLIEGTNPIQIEMKRHALLLVLVLALAPPALAQTTITIDRCYDGDTCTSTKGEKIRLACIDTPELRGKRADPIPAKAARDYLNGLVAGEEVSIRRITKDRYGRTVAELSKDGVNIQERLVDKGFASVYKRYSDQCDWSRSNLDRERANSPSYKEKGG